MRLKGQMFSIDFVIAMALLTVAIGITIQSLDLFQKRVQSATVLYTENAELIAQNYTHYAAGFKNATPYCISYSNGSEFSSNCNEFRYCDLAGNNFTATRIVPCSYNFPSISGPCSLTVYTCE
ncbi:hypothetical protein HY989_06080 [Candidatus Micrarchaeota archaeon]|nr:hypothetical protein [Candidatus Micrarchaeota archaeon]